MGGKITFKQHLKSSSRIQGELLNLNFQILTTANFTVNWFHNDKLVEPSNEAYTIVTDNEFGRCQLQFKETKPADSGCYRVEIECDGTKAISVCTVIVKETITGVLFDDFPNSTTVDEGAEVTIKCSLCAAAAVFWKKGDVTLDSTDRYKFIDTDDTALFKISSALPEDTGIYTADVMDLATDEVAQCHFVLQVLPK